MVYGILKQPDLNCIHSALVPAFHEGSTDCQNTVNAGKYLEKLNFYTLIVPVETFLRNVIRSLSNGYFTSSISTMVHVRVSQSESSGKVETWK